MRGDERTDPGPGPGTSAEAPHPGSKRMPRWNVGDLLYFAGDGRHAQGAGDIEVLLAVPRPVTRDYVRG